MADPLAIEAVRRGLLSCFAPQVGWAERDCVQKTWRTLRGEAPLGSKALPAPPPVSVPAGADGGEPPSAVFSGVGRIFGLHNFESGALLGDGNYSQVFEAIVRPTQERVAFKVVDKQKMSRYKKGDEVLIEKYVLTEASHPSIVKLFHTFQDAVALYVRTEQPPLAIPEPHHFNSTSLHN